SKRVSVLLRELESDELMTLKAKVFSAAHSMLIKVGIKEKNALHWMKWQSKMLFLSGYEDFTVVFNKLFSDKVLANARLTALLVRVLTEVSGIDRGLVDTMLEARMPAFKASIPRLTYTDPVEEEKRVAMEELFHGQDLKDELTDEDLERHMRTWLADKEIERESRDPKVIGKYLLGTRLSPNVSTATERQKTEVIDRHTFVRARPQFAIKIAKHIKGNDPKQALCLLREYLVMKRLEGVHGVLHAHDIGYRKILNEQGEHIGNEIIVVRDLVEGVSLYDVMRRPDAHEVKLSPIDTIKLAKSIVRTVEEMHAKGIIHADLKLSNIFLTKIGRNKYDLANPLLGDYGISLRLPEEGVVNLGRLPGTPSYLPPEACEKREYSTKTDMYAFGCILYRLLAGKLPFVDAPEENLGVFVTRKKKGAVSVGVYNHDVPASLEKVIMKLLDPDPGKRYESATEVRHALECIEKEVSPDGLYRHPFSKVRQEPTPEFREQSLKAIKDNAEGKKLVEKLAQALMDLAGLTPGSQKKEKVILALDLDLGEGDINKLFEELAKVLPPLTDKKGELGLFLRNLEIIKGRGKDFSERIKHLDIKDENLIVITPHAEYYDNLSRATVAEVERSGFPKGAYIPLLEIALFAVAKHLASKEDSIIKSEDLQKYYRMIPNVILADDLGKAEYKRLFRDGSAKRFIIRLIPDAVPFTDEVQELRDSLMAALRRA
ncbi:MAG: serine/threonine-protein kinase, partial [Candidatus Omnitrophota bacterium]